MEFQIATGNPQLDQQQLAQFEAQYAAQGYALQATPLPTGGFHVRVVPAGGAAAAQGGYPAPQGAPGAAPNPYGAPQGAPGAAPNPYGAPQGAPGGAPQGAWGGTPQGAPGAAPSPQGAPQGAWGGAPAASPAGVTTAGAASKSSGIPFLQNWRVLNGAVLAIAAIAGAAMFVMPDLPVAVVAGIAAGLALVLCVGLVVVARPKILHSIGAIGLSIVLGAVGGGVMWFLTHPSVYVDNPTKDAIQVYVDGEPVLSLGPGAHDSVSVHKGKHSFGWSPKALQKPTAMLDSEVKFMKAHLYNPGKTGCYWLQVDTYGNVSDGGRAAGPQTIEEFYVFDSVDNWFTENPGYVTVKKEEKGKVKTALQQGMACMKFSHCSFETRAKLVGCQQAAFKKESVEEFAACGDEAARTCTSGGGATTAPPGGAAAPKPGAKPVAKPAPKRR